MEKSEFLVRIPYVGFEIVVSVECERVLFKEAIIIRAFDTLVLNGFTNAWENRPSFDEIEVQEL